MRILSVLLAVGLVVLVGGCSSMTTNYDYDPTADFTTFTSYAWMGRDAASGQVRAGDMTDKRIRAAVDYQMEQKGMTIDTDAPDLLVAYYAGVESKVDVTDWGYRYYGGWYGRDVDVYQYDEGSIVLDMVDTSTNELAWRGVVSDVVSGQQSPEQRQQHINEAAAVLLSNFPPK